MHTRDYFHIVIVLYRCRLDCDQPHPPVDKRNLRKAYTLFESLPSCLKRRGGKIPRFVGWWVEHQFICIGPGATLKGVTLITPEDVANVDAYRVLAYKKGWLKYNSLSGEQFWAILGGKDKDKKEITKPPILETVTSKLEEMVCEVGHTITIPTCIVISLPSLSQASPFILF
jgi:hypothetical protein